MDSAPVRERMVGMTRALHGHAAAERLRAHYAKQDARTTLRTPRLEVTRRKGGGRVAGLFLFGIVWLLGWTRWQVEAGAKRRGRGCVLVFGWPLERPNVRREPTTWRVGFGPLAVRTWWRRKKRTVAEYMHARRLQ